MVLIPGGESIKDSLSVDTTQKYAFVFDYSLLDTKFFINLEHGKIEVKITDQENIELDKAPLVQKMTSTGTAVFKELTLHRTKEFFKDAGFFNKLFVHITCKKDTYFTIGTNKQEAHFHKIKPGTPAIIKFNNRQQNSYFVDLDALTDVEELELRFERINAEFMNVKEDHNTKSEWEKIVVEHSKFRYLNAQQFGTKDSRGNLGTEAVIMDRVSIVHEERAYFNYKLVPDHGYLMIVPAMNITIPDSQEVKVILNVVINGMIPMPSSTSLSATIDPTKKHIYQISLKPNSKINVKVSLCQGGNIRAGFLDHNKVPTMKVNPMNPDSILSFLEVITLNSSIKNGRPFKDLSYGPIGGEETVIYLQVESANNSTQPTAYNVVSEETKIDDYSSIREWIHTLYAPYIKEGKQYPFEWEQDPEEIHHKFPPVLPSQEFLAAHPEINAFQVKYTVYMTNEDISLSSMNNTCELDHFSKQESFNWRKTVFNYIKPENGKFDLSKDPVKISTGYPVLHDPYYFGTLQVTMTFIQDASNELTDEASVMFKFT